MSKTSNKNKLQCLKKWMYDFEKKSKNLRYLKKKRNNKPKTLYSPNYHELGLQ